MHKEGCTGRDIYRKGLTQGSTYIGRDVQREGRIHGKTYIRKDIHRERHT